MKTILIGSLSGHWAVMFALASVQTTGAGMDDAFATVATLATANALVAALFLWGAVCAAMGARFDDAVRFACAAAVVTMAITALLDMAAFSLETIALQLAALGVTYLVIRAEAAEISADAVPDHSLVMARRLAVSAAHNAMLSRLSRRCPAENEA